MSSAIPLSGERGSLYRELYLRLRQEILTGATRGGERLPSTRDLAEQLGVSRTVVLQAYDQLLAEGFTVARQGSGTYVSTSAWTQQPAPATRVALRLTRFGAGAVAAWSRASFPGQGAGALPYDFAYGRSDLETFPLVLWRRLLLRAARRAPARQFYYGAEAGSAPLREAICAQLRRSRAVVCDPAQVIVVNGSQQALDLIARVLVERGDRVAVEDPCYQGTREILTAAGARLHPVPVDREGLDPARLPVGARVAFVTPSHQFPTGVILSLARRQALLEWARKHQALIVEDDYDGEFRYQGQPLESLQGLDGGARVIYVGTFSRTMFPALRIGYLVAPEPLVAALTFAKWLSDRQTRSLEQEALSEFIADGMYDRHLRRLRRRNAGRRQVLVAAIAEHLHGRVEVSGDGAGAHVVLWPQRCVGEEALVTAAAARGVGVYGISGYYVRKPSRPGILLGYDGMREAQIREGVRRLGAVF